MNTNRLEYVLFDIQWVKRFIDFLQTLNIEYHQTAQGDHFIVSIPDDLDEEVDERVEAEYQKLLDAHETEDTEIDEMNRVGIQYRNLANETCQVRADMTIVNRLLSVVTLDELQQFVQEVASEVEQGGKKRICEK